MGKELPEGFVLDKPTTTDIQSGLPPGFVVDSGPKDEAVKLGDVQEAEEGSFFHDSFETLANVGKVYPALETVANVITSAYGIPLSGLAGIFSLPFGIEAAGKAVQKAQDLLVYQPQTEGGRQFTEAATYPLRKYEEGAAAVGEVVADIAGPTMGATVHTAISGAPALLGGKLALGKSPKAVRVRLDRKTKAAIKKGINKGIRPSVVKKSTARQVEKYNAQAETAVQEIVKNSDNLVLLDETGAVAEGLPKTLHQFSQAIEQTKRNIFQEYDSLAKQADVTRPKRSLRYPLRKGERAVFSEEGGFIEGKPVRIDLDSTATKLDSVINSKVLGDLSPETIEYAKARAEVLKGRDRYSAVETQEAIQMLNQTLEQFYREPSPAMKGKALVDSLIANDLRAQLDTVIQNTTGKNYKALKQKYGALKTIESDVTKRAIVDARKNNKGLLDFSDIFSGHQVIHGMLRGDPVSIAAGSAAKGISKYYKMLNDPNRIVKKMFSEVEKLNTAKAAVTPARNVMPLAGAANIPERNE